MSGNLRVHIVPVGYQHKRVTEPLISMRADKVYFVRHTEDNETASRQYEKICDELAQEYKHIEIEEIRLDLWDIHACIGAFRGIVQEGGNHFYVNVSTGTKITAIAGMLACMMWGAVPYYARVSYLGTTDPPPSGHADDAAGPPVNGPLSGGTDPLPSERVDDPCVVLPVYGINKPRPEFMRILSILQSRNGPVGKSELIRALEGKGMIKAKRKDGAELSGPTKHNQLNALLGPMKSEWNLVSIKDLGRTREVSITEQGGEALKIFGAGGI